MLAFTATALPSQIESRKSTQNATQLFAADRDDIAAISVAAI
jgi:hypothetical protein